MDPSLNSSVLYSSSLVSVISTWELLLQMLGRTCAARHSHTCALLFDGIFFVDVAHGFFGEEALFSVVADGLRETIKCLRWSTTRRKYDIVVVPF